MEAWDRFTPGEQKVIEQLLQGKSNKQIALALSLSERTIEAHLGHIYQKLGVGSRAEAILQLGKTHQNPLSTVLVESTIEKNHPGKYKEISFILKRFKLNSSGLYAGVFIVALVILASIFRSSQRFAFEREAEFPDEYTVGRTLDRSEASGKKVHGQFGTVPAWPAQPGSVTYKYISIPATDHLYIMLRYSKNGSSAVPILIFLDDESTPRASVFPEDQQDWNRFTWTKPIDLGKLESGIHSITFYTEGQEYGVADLDRFILTIEPP